LEDKSYYTDLIKTGQKYNKLEINLGNLTVIITGGKCTFFNEEKSAKITEGIPMANSPAEYHQKDPFGKKRRVNN
jgi:hypothetical protein